MKIIAYLHTHWDREWYRTFEEFRIRFAEVFEDIVNKLENGDFSQFYLDGQTILIDDLLEIYPTKKDLIKKLIKQKKIVIGPWYTLADEFLVSGECLIRNLLIGINQAKKMGVDDFVGYLPDAFGHSAGMVQILDSFGIKNAVLWRGAGEQKSEFVWKAKSDAKITVTHLLEGYFQDFLTAGNLDGLKNLLEKIKLNNIGDLILLPIGADHLGACNDLPEKVQKFNQNNDFELKIGSIYQYLETKKENLPEFVGELRDNSKNFILPGTYSTRNYLKRKNTLTTWELKKIESFLAFCNSLNLFPSQKEFLDYSWKLLLQNHAHDSICGCSIDFVHDEMELRFAKINQILKALKEKAISKFKEGKTLVVFNSSGFEYSGNVEIKTTAKLKQKDGFELISKEKYFPSKILQNIHQIPISEDLTNIYTYLANVENISSLSLKTAVLKPEKGVEIFDNAIENVRFRIDVGNDGGITVIDKSRQKTYQNTVVFEDRADVGDTYNFSPIVDDKPILATFVKSKILKKGCLRSILELEYQIKIPKLSDKFRSEKEILHKIKTQIILDAKSPIIKFKTIFKNKSQNHILQAKFGMAENIVKTVSEDSIGLVERNFDPFYNIQSQSPAENFQELKTNTAPMQRFVWTQGVGLFTKGLHEYEINQNKLAITLFRAVGMLSGRNLHSRLNPAGPTIKTPGAQCLRTLTFEYALTFCDEPKELYSLADSYFDPTVAFLSDEISNIEIGFNNPNVNLIACKEAENRAGIVIRLQNISIESQNIDITGIPLTSEEFPLSDEPETIVLKPYELKSVLVCQNFSK